MKNKKSILFLILGLCLPFIGAIISMWIKNEDAKLAIKRGSVFSGLIVFLFFMGVAFYFMGAEMGRTE